ncbi:MAG: outer membrane protein assembly factor BamA [Polyangiaceae bacterium]|nr:outer membrane protein assembly factor BamA [Polyangiaceae bacterium]
MMKSLTRHGSWVPRKRGLSRPSNLALLLLICLCAQFFALPMVFAQATTNDESPENAATSGAQEKEVNAEPDNAKPPEEVTAEPAEAEPAEAKPAEAEPSQPEDPKNPAEPAPGDENLDTTIPEDAAIPDDPALVSLPTIPGGDLEAAEGLPIRRIDVTGVRRISASDLRSYLRLKIGDPLTPDALSRDVRELWRAGFFDDIEVDLRLYSDGVSLRYLVKEKPAVKAVEFENNEVIDDDDLKEAIGVKENSTLSRPAIERALQKIRDMYAEQGYFLAEAKYDIVSGPNNEVTVQFTITEHEQVSVRRVTIIGNEGISTKELKGAMFTGNPGIMGFGSGGPFRQDAFERDIAVISSMYYDRGYLEVSVHTPRVMLTPDKEGIEVSFTIDEGRRFRIRQLRIFEQGPDGSPVEPLGGRRNLRLMLRAESGDYFSYAQLREDLAAVRAMYRDAGYANATAEPQTNIDPSKTEVDVVVPVVRGPMVYFERIEFRGNTKTRDKVIRRQLEIIEGAKFSETKMNRSRRRVTALGYFERVDFSTEQGSSPDKLVVYIDVTEKPTGTFQVGAGFSSIENFIATAQVQQANLFGNGQSLSLQAQISGIRQTIDLRLVEPYFMDTRFSTSISLFDQWRAFPDYSQRSRGGSLTIGYPLIEPEVNISLTYNAQLVDVSTSSGQTLLGGTASRSSSFDQLPLANLFNDGLTSSLRPAISFDNRDNRLFPTSGMFLNLGTEWAAPWLGSENNYIRTTWQGRFYVPIKWGAVLKLNSNTGMVTSPNADGVPIFARFFLGGILDLRGYRFRTVGPRMPLTQTTDPNSRPIANGANIGGNLMYYQNLEFEFPIFGELGLKGVIFTDLGNAWNLEGNYCDAAGGAASDPRYQAVSPCFTIKDLFRVRTSWGFGIRWFSPLGPLRFEWGIPFRPLPYEEPIRFEFTIGNFF